MADLKTTNIYGDAYINNKVGINTNTPATRLQIGQLSPTAATEGLQFGDDTSARIYRTSAGVVRTSGGFQAATYILADNYLQTGGNLIYPSSPAATQRLEVGNSANNAWIDGITIAPGGNVNVYNNLSSVNGYVYAGTYLQSGNSTIYAAGYGNTLVLNVGNASGNNWINGIAIAQGGNVTIANNLTVNNNATVTNDLTVNGNTYLGNANNDTVYVNDTIRIGATDSGDASLFFGEGAVAGSDYGARWYWDSGYTFTWYTRNAGTDTALFDYVTNDTSYINWRRHFHMQNKEINYNAQVHFNAGTRFVGSSTEYLIFRSDSTNAGGIQIQNGSSTVKGYTGYWDSAGGGILNNTGNWAVRYNFGNANSGGTLYGDWTVNANLTVTGITMTNLTGAYQNTTVYDSPKTQSATPSRGIRAPASSIQFTDSYAIAPSWTFRSTGDWPVPYGIGWGTGGESSGIFQRYHSNGYSFGDMIFYTGNDGYGAFSFRRHTWEGTTHFAAGSGELNTELFRIDWSGNLTMLGTLNGSANSATLYANNGSYGAWAINGTRNGWGGIEFANNGVSLMMGSDTVGFHQNTNGWLFRVHNGSGFIYKGSWGGGTAATIFDSSNYTTLANGVLLRAAGGPGGYGDWNTFGNVTQTTNVITTEYFNLNGGSGNSNFPPVVSYTYGILANLGSNSDARAQVYISHAGNDLIFRGGWGTSSWQTWNRVLTNINQPYAYAMNQYVRTTDVPTFSGVYTNLIGINDGGMDCYMEVTDSNPTFNYEAYGGEFYFYGDKSRPSSLLYVGGIDVSRTVIATAISSRDYTRQLFPGGGYYHEGGSVTGAIKIRLPANTKSVYPMLSFTCHIYNYSTGTSRTFKIGGHYSNTQWYNPFAYCLSDNVGNLNVRFGYEGTYLCVWIGETNSGWSYPTVFITDFQNGYSAIDGIWMTGWSVTRVTAFDTVTNGPYTPGYFWNQNNDGAGSGLDADLLDGYSSATAGTANTIVLRDSNGHITGQYILGSYFNASAGNSENPTIGQIWTQNTSDNYLRKSTPAHFRSQVTDGSYPSLTGANASGTWSISVTGNAATATSADNIDGRPFVNTNSNSATNADSINSNGISYYNGGVTNFSGNATDGALYSQAYSNDWQHQIAGDYRSGQIALRGKNNGTWQSWRTVLDSTNYSSYAGGLSTGNTFTNTNVFYSPNNTTIGGLSGNYGLTVYQGTAGTDAYMTFHVGGDFAAYFGLGGAENDLVYGGWSVGNFRYRILHSSNAAYAWNMNQYVRTTDSPTFNTVTANITGNAYNNLSNDYKDIYVYGDVNTYYIVLIQGEYLYSFGRYSVTRGYNWTGPDTWNTATHKGGLTLDWEWSGDTAWGGNDKAIRIIEFNESYSTMVAGLGYPVNGGVIIWLRGGGVNGAQYRIRTPNGSNSTVTVYDGLSIANHVASTTFTAADSTVFSSRANTNNVSAEILVRYPVRATGGLFDGNNAVLHAGNYNSYSPTLTGTGASGNWAINITGNAATATTLQTARNINGTSFNGSAAITTATWGTARTLTIGSTGKSVDGSANVSWTLAEIGAAATNQTMFIGTTSVAINRASAAITLTGTSIDGTAGGLNSSNYISRIGSSGNYNTDFQNTPAGTVRHQGDDYAMTNNPGGGWWFVDNYRHSNASNYWGTQVAWGWEDQANKLATRNITGGTFGSWVYYLNSVNYTDYTVTKTGTGASGNWAINVTGNAATVTNGIYTTSYYTGTPLGKRRYRIHTADTTSLDSSITSLECGFTYGGSGEPTGPFIAFGGLGGAIDYSCQLVGAYSGGNDFKIRTRNDDTAAWNPWRTIITDGNYTSYTVTKTGTGASGTWSINVTGNAGTATTLQTARAINGTNFDGSAAITTANWGTARTITIGNTGKSVDGSGNYSWSLAEIGASGTTVNSNNTAALWYPVVYHSGNTLYSSPNVQIYAGGSYLQAAYFNSSDDISTGNITHIMAKFGDNYIRSATAAKVAAFITGQTMNIAGSSTSCTGNAATATNVAASGITGQTGMWTSAARPGPYRLYRNDHDSAYNLQLTWQAHRTNYWSLRGYLNDTFHAECFVVYSGYADEAGALTIGNTYRVANLGINVAASNKLHINGDNTNPAIRIDNGALVTGVASNSKNTFQGYLPVSFGGTTYYIRLWT